MKQQRHIRKYRTHIRLVNPNIRRNHKRDLSLREPILYPLEVKERLNSKIDEIKNYFKGTADIEGADRQRKLLERELIEEFRNENISSDTLEKLNERMRRNLPILMD